MKANVKQLTPVEELEAYIEQEYQNIKKADRLLCVVLGLLCMLIAAVATWPEWFN